MFSSVLMTTLEGHVSWSKWNFFGREVWRPFGADRRVPGGQMTRTRAYCCRRVLILIQKHHQHQSISRISASAGSAHQQDQHISRLSGSAGSAHQQDRCISTSAGSAHHYISSISASAASVHHRHQRIISISSSASEHHHQSIIISANTQIQLMTRNRIRVANLSGCVTKILALQRWLKIDFPPVHNVLFVQ